MRKLCHPLFFFCCWLGLALAGIAIALHCTPAALYGQTAGVSRLTPTVAFAPLLTLIPSEDGTALYAQLQVDTQIAGDLQLHITGPTSQKRSYTMHYSPTATLYTAAVVGYTPGASAEGTINLTTTAGLATTVLPYSRHFVPTNTAQSYWAADGNLEVRLFHTDTLPVDTYLVIAPGLALPGPLPVGYELVGSAYSLRAAGALLQTERPFTLQIRYAPATLADADPHMLALLAWDAHRQTWTSLAGRLFVSQQAYAATATRFTTYALVQQPAWHDDFDDLTGLTAPVQQVTIGASSNERALVLAPNASAGQATSLPISPTVALAAWGSVIYTATQAAPTTTVTVDLLTADGVVVMADVANGAELAALDPQTYPALRLRATLQSAAPGHTPLLSAWQLTWQGRPARTSLYLPLIQRR